MSVALTKTWIDRRLSRKDREKLIDYLLERTSSPTGEQILDALGELFPGREDLPSVRSCNEWKAKSWKLVLQLRQLREDSEVARIISESNGKLADANANLADAYVFGELRKLREGGDVDPRFARMDTRGLPAGNARAGRQAPRIRLSQIACAGGKA